MNNTTESNFSLSAPSSVLLVRKSEYRDFFEDEQLPDSKTSFITNFSSSDNAYTFSNLARLITICKNQRDQDAGVLPSDSELSVKPNTPSGRLNIRIGINFISFR